LEILNLKRNQCSRTGSKVTAILLEGWILLVGGVALGRVCACSLRSRERNRPCADLRYWEKDNIGPSALNVADYAVATKNSLSEKC
jgi:hypothetical protein